MKFKIKPYLFLKIRFKIDVNIILIYKFVRQNWRNYLPLKGKNVPNYKRLKNILNPQYIHGDFFSVKGDAVKLLKHHLVIYVAICSRFSYFYHRLTGLPFVLISLNPHTSITMMMHSKYCSISPAGCWEENV